MNQELEKQVVGSTKKKIVAYIGVFFLVGVVILSFFSKTIAGLSMQKVTIARGKMGYLEQEARYEGKASFEKDYKIFAPSKGKVKRLYIKEGDRVEKGQLLCEVEFDDSQYELEKKQLDLEKCQLTYKHLEEKVSDLALQCEKAHQKLDTLKQKAQSKIEERAKPAASQISDEDELDLVAAEKKLADNEALYEVGAITKSDLENARVEVERLKLKISKSKEDQAKEDQREAEASQIAIENQEAVVESLMSQKKQIVQEMESNQLEQKALQMELAHLEKVVNLSGEIYGTEAGVVLKLEIGQGEQILDGQEMMQIGSLEAGAKVNFIVSEDQKLLAIGDSVSLSIPALKQNQLPGSITSIKNNETGLVVEAHFECPEMTGDEKVDIEVRKQAEEQHLIIPYSAINKEKTGYFVFVVDPIEDAMGSGYKVRKYRVGLGGHNLDSVEIIDGITQSVCVVISSENVIQAGMQVKVENEEVFYNESPNE